jgi:hypothetical protein
MTFLHSSRLRTAGTFGIEHSTEFHAGVKLTAASALDHDRALLKARPSGDP